MIFYQVSEYPVFGIKEFCGSMGGFAQADHRFISHGIQPSQILIFPGKWIFIKRLQFVLKDIHKHFNLRVQVEFLRSFCTGEKGQRQKQGQTDAKLVHEGVFMRVRIEFQGTIIMP